MKQLMMITLTVVLTALGCGAAHADPGDAEFLQRIAGMPGDRTELISIAHGYCAALQLPSVGLGGPSPRYLAILQLKERAAAQGIDTNSMQFAFAAEDSYCPGTDSLRQH